MSVFAQRCARQPTKTDMSHFLERLTYLTRRCESFADGHGELRDEDRMWEEGYRRCVYRKPYPC